MQAYNNSEDIYDMADGIIELLVKRNAHQE